MTVPAPCPLLARALARLPERRSPAARLRDAQGLSEAYAWLASGQAWWRPGVREWERPERREG